jgi:hypothetical protein
MLSSSSVVILVLSIGLASSFSLSFKSAAVSRQALSIKNYQSSPLFSKANVDKKRDLALFAASEETTLDKDGNKVVDFDVSAWLNINTRGGVLVWCAILTIIPIAAYAYFVSTGLEETTVGAYVGALFVLLTMVAWASTYIFRVATKDMTYAKQLRDYENAVLEKRLSELADDEIDALMREIELEGDEDANAPQMKGMNNDSR